MRFVDATYYSQRNRQIMTRARIFGRADNGNVASIFALCFVALFGFLGGAIDLVQAHRTRTALNSGIDAGVLAAARAKQTGATDAEALAVADNYLTPVKARLKMTEPVTFSIGDAGTSVTGSADYSMPTSFLRVIGISGVPIRASSAATFGNRSNVELSMMLDITGSMGGTKIADLKAAVEDLIEVVVADNQIGYTSRVALAPFSNAVKLDTKAFREATGKDNSGTGSYKGCVVERTGKEAYTDAAPGLGAFVMPLEEVAPFANCKDGSDIVPLTSKKSDLKNMVKSLVAGGATAGHLGTAWAWYLLSPNWSAAFDGSSTPASYADLKTEASTGLPKLRKIAVLMTDGEYNTQYTGVSSNTQARNICDEMRKTGIEVFTVGFEIGETGAAVDTLRQCASAVDNFYNAKNGAELKQAFRDIALKSSPLRIVK